jgi:hypothetical protein
MTARRTLLAIAPDAAGAVVRHRALAFRLALARRGVALEAVGWPKEKAERRRVLLRAKEAGSAWVLSRLLAVRDLGRLRRRVKRLLFDFDDALPFRDTSRGATRSWTRTRRFRAALEAADAVIAGNAYLASLAKEEGKEARVLPTVVACRDGAPSPEPPCPPTVLGWVGSRSTIPYLEGLRIPLAALVAGGHPVRLRVVADAVPLMPPGIPVEAVRWSRETEGPALEGAHAGLAPLPDDPWTRGKCGLRVVQFLARGRPVVASPVGVQAEQVRHGVTGFLAGDPESYLAALSTLVADPALRRRMGEAAIQDARARWSVAAWEDRVADFVAGAIEA